MIRCWNCHEEVAGGLDNCSKCGAEVLETPFLEGIAEPDDPLEEIEDRVVVLRTRDASEAELARGLLEANGVEASVYPEGGGTGMEVLGLAGIVGSFVGQDRFLHSITRIVRVLVQPQDVGAATRVLRDVRDNPPDEKEVEAAESEAETGSQAP